VRIRSPLLRRRVLLAKAYDDVPVVERAELLLVRGSVRLLYPTFERVDGERGRRAGLVRVPERLGRELDALRAIPYKNSSSVS
jgi:hypothetical protein